MYCISDEQIDFILTDIGQRGIRVESLQHNLLDHICIIIEQELEEGEDFGQFYESVLKTFYKKELREIEAETLFLSTFKNHLVLSRNFFFGWLFIIFIGPYIGYDLIWMTTSAHTNGWIFPSEIWASTLVFAAFPHLVLTVLFLTPERYDPLIPKRSKILLGTKPFIKIIPEDAISVREEIMPAE